MLHQYAIIYCINNQPYLIEFVTVLRGAIICVTSYDVNRTKEKQLSEKSGILNSLPCTSILNVIGAKANRSQSYESHHTHLYKLASL